MTELFESPERVIAESGFKDNGRRFKIAFDRGEKILLNSLTSYSGVLRVKWWFYYRA
jgi:hypothetical protein